MTKAIHARWIYFVNSNGLEDSVDSDQLVDRMFEERIRYLTLRGERRARIHDPPYGLPSKKGVIWNNPPQLFDCQKRSPAVINPGAPTDPRRCPSISFDDVPCPCFDFNDNTTKYSHRSFSFLPSWSIGEYVLFVKEESKNPRRHEPEEAIELRGGLYLHPTVSAKRICKSSIKADTVVQYLWRMMKPVLEEHEVKPQEWYGWRDIFCVDKETDHEPTELPTAYNAYATTTSYVEHLADKWPMSETHLQALKALAYATRIYHQLDGATISLKVVETLLNEAPWLGKHGNRHSNLRNLDRPSNLACIVHFESGILLLEPDELIQTLAIASGNSIFVIGAIVSDPFETLRADCVKRIVGNIGRTGICMLVAPFEPKIRPLGTQYNLVEHAVYDGKRENNFKATSLHLSFTDWTLPLEVKGAEGRTIDQEAYLVESVISVLDSGKWVADLDILCIDFEALTRLGTSQKCPGHPNGCTDYDYTSIDRWEEFLDRPMSVGVFRAHGNWAARLAAVSILSQKDQAHAIGVLGPKASCLECLGSDYDTTGVFKKYESPLPSFCID